MPDLELKKRHAALYKPGARLPALVDVPPLRFLMLDGVGDVGGPSHQDAVRSLYGLAFPVKFEAKKRLGLTYPVMPLESLYGDPSTDDPPTKAPADIRTLAWRLMILLPDEVPAEFVDEVRAKVATKKRLARLDDVRVQTFSEGSSVQILHIGPYAEEPSTIRRLFAFAAQKGLAVTGRHHEIHLGDPLKTDPSKLKTILRFGVSRRR